MPRRKQLFKQETLTAAETAHGGTGDGSGPDRVGGGIERGDQLDDGGGRPRSIDSFSFVYQLQHAIHDQALLFGSAMFAAAAAILWEWQPAPPRAVSSTGPPASASALDVYFHSPAEAGFRASEVMGWMARWRALPAVISCVYLLILRFAGFLMVRRGRPVTCPRIRLLWNLALSLFSLICVSRVVPALLLSFVREGFVATVCAPPELGLGNGAAGLWNWLFVMSKLVELGDTSFLVLGRKPLTLLHTWHHASVLVWACQQYVACSGPAVLFVAMNAVVHTPMYLYFAAVEFLPSHGMRSFAMTITTIQTTQMFLGLLITAIAACTPSCAFSSGSAAFSAAIYLSYLVLFLRFADKAYALRARLRHYAFSLRHHQSRSESASDTAEQRLWRKAGLSQPDAFAIACQSVPLYLGHLREVEAMQLYGLYKQVHCGDLPGVAPPLSADSAGTKAEAKLAAWAQQRGRSTAECQLEYMRILDAIASRINEFVHHSPVRQRNPTAAARSHGADSAAAVSARPGALFAVRIAGVGRYLPSRIVTTAEIERRGGFKPGSLSSGRSAVLERRRASLSEWPADMSAKAALEALAEANLQPSQVDAIINASGTQEQFIPDGSVRIQHALGLEDSGIPCFSIHATCISFVVALEAAAALLQRPDGKYNSILVCAGEVMTHGLDPWDAHCAPLFGDGAAAVVLVRSGSDEPSAIHAAQLETYSSGRDLTVVAAGGCRFPNHSRDESIDHRLFNPALKYEHGHFKMDGEATIRFVAARMPNALEALLPGLSSGLGDIDWVVPHQASGLALDSLAIYGWPHDRIIRTIETLGNVVAASIPLTLYEGVKSGKIRRGDKVLLCGTGAGLTFGGMIITY